MNALFNRLVMLGIVASIVLSWTPAEAAVIYRTVALASTAAPGTPNSVNFGGFNLPTLNASGHTTFAALLRDGGVVTSVNDEGLWSEGSGTLTLIAREGSPAPGTPEGTYFGQIVLFGQSVVTNNNGSLVFQAWLQFGDNVTIDNSEGIWTDLTGSLTLVARRGSQAPGTPDGTNFYNTFQSIVLNDVGQIAFCGSAAISGDTTSKLSGIWLGRPGELTLAARTGSPAPGTPNGTTFNNFVRPNGLHPVALNNKGQIVFRATLDSPDGSITQLNREGIWSEGSGALALVARAGSQAPGTPIGANFSRFWDPALNDAGQTAFLATLAPGAGGVTLSNHIGIWAERSGSLSLVAREGSQAPGTPDGTVFGNFLNSAGVSPSSPVLNGSGQIAFRGWLATGVGGVTNSNDQGIWSDGSGTLTLVAREGDAAPGMPAGYKFGAFGNPVMNASGHVAFMASPADVSVEVVPSYSGIWAEDSTGVLRLIVRTGDVIEVSPGVFSTIDQLDFGRSSALPSGGEDGRAIVFNDDFTVSFRAMLHNYDGSSGIIIPSGIFTATIIAVPEPSTLALFFMAAMFVPRRWGANSAK